MDYIYVIMYLFLFVLFIYLFLNSVRFVVCLFCLFVCLLACFVLSFYLLYTYNYNIRNIVISSSTSLNGRFWNARNLSNILLTEEIQTTWDVEKLANNGIKLPTSTGWLDFMYQQLVS